jgi:ankyrin repeat protein
LLDILLRHRNLDVNLKFENETALQVAARRGKSVAVKALAKFGAKMNATDRKGRTPLIVAAGEGHESTVRALLEHGASMNSRYQAEDLVIRSAEDEAKAKGHDDVAKLLRVWTNLKAAK